jgi:hypothetical protein
MPGARPPHARRPVPEVEDRVVELHGRLVGRRHAAEVHAPGAEHQTAGEPHGGMARALRAECGALGPRVDGGVVGLRRGHGPPGVDAPGDQHTAVLEQRRSVRRAWRRERCRAVPPHAARVVQLTRGEKACTVEVATGHQHAAVGKQRGGMALPCVVHGRRGVPASRRLEAGGHVAPPTTASYAHCDHLWAITLSPQQGTSALFPHDCRDVYGCGHARTGPSELGHATRPGMARHGTSVPPWRQPQWICNVPVILRTCAKRATRAVRAGLSL